MVAFVASIIVTLVLTAGILWYTGRRPKDAPLTWGEAMVGATYVFFLLFWVYGVVPHQWLTLADNEWNWRPDRLLSEFDVFGTEPLGFLEPESAGGSFPLTMHHQHLRDIVAVVIYGIALGGNIWLWSVWQKRGQKAEDTTVERSQFGRPLIREGVREGADA